MSIISHDNRFMEFKMGDQLYSVPLLSVREVIQKPEITPMPNCPADFEGMMNLRGQLLGVFNVRKKLSSNAKPKNNEHTVVVIIERNGISVGMIVDEVTRVLSTESDMIKAAPVRADDPSKKFIQSIIHTESDLVLILDLEQLLEFKKYEKATTAA